MKQPARKRVSVSRIWILVGATVLVAGGLLVMLAFLQPGSAAPQPQQGSESIPPATTVPPSATPRPTPTSSPIVASVDGYVITEAHLEKSTALNRVLSEFAGQEPLAESDTLQRLIRQQLVIQGVALEGIPDEQDVGDYLVRMQEAWNVDEDTVLSALETAGVDRSFLEETIQRLLVVQAATDLLSAQGHDINQWLQEQEKAADIRVLADVSEAPPKEPGQSSTPLPTTDGAEVPPTDTPSARPEVPSRAPDFTLRKAGGGSLTLSRQLEEGPVVLVFFQRCG